MSARKISQREARRLRKRVTELEDAQRQRVNRWYHKYPSGIHIDTVSINSVEYGIADTAMKLGYTLVVKLDGQSFLVYAVKS